MAAGEVSGTGEVPSNRTVRAAHSALAGNRRSAVRRTLLVVSLAAMLAVYLIATAPTVVAAVRSLAGASPMWLLVGAFGTAGSMIAFAALRGRTLAVAGAQVPLRRTVAVSYGAAAVHTTLPAGAVFSTAYAFRHLRSSGASASAITWSLAITGLLSTLTLSGIGLLGLGLTAGTGGSITKPVLEVLLSAAIVSGVVQLARHPDASLRVAVLMVMRVNRLRGRSAQTGVGGLSRIVADLTAVRPSGRDWMVATALALANWFLDLACLAACCAGVGVHVSFPALLLTYTAGMAAGSLLPLPGGLGAVETALTFGLAVAGASASPALAAVLLYRVLSTGSVVILGWLVVAAQRVKRHSVDQALLR